MDNINIKVERSLRFKGQHVEKGTILENLKADDGEVLNCLASGRAVVTKEKAPPPKPAKA